MKSSHGSRKCGPKKSTEKPAVKLFVCTMGGGTLPGLDIRNSPSLLDQMEGIHCSRWK